MNVYKFIPHYDYDGYIIIAANNPLEAIKIISANELYSHIYYHCHCSWEKIEYLSYNNNVPCVLLEYLINLRTTTFHKSLYH